MDTLTWKRLRNGIADGGMRLCERLEAAIDGDLDDDDDNGAVIAAAQAKLAAYAAALDQLSDDVRQRESFEESLRELIDELRAGLERLGAPAVH